ncbi:hypothetical protein QCA50_020209 [Cerrena zonata]|uniref:SWIM-type domain-containing protein n=1 Tax=Cerrena zonata TaxID=2478898 RepID=A0AAW0FGW4_9APHY
MTPSYTSAPSSTQWDDRKLDVKFNVAALYCTEAQREAIHKIHGPNGSRVAKVFPETPSGQTTATAFLTERNLDQHSLAMLESRWSIANVWRWSRKGDVKVVRTLYQCVCGYDTPSRQRGKQQKKTDHPDTSPSDSTSEWRRRAAYDFTGCLVHADITYLDMQPRVITRVVGFFEHNDACRESRLVRYPPVPIHDHVIEVALRQLRQGASVNTIQKTNLDMIQRHAYRNQTKNLDSACLNVRYEILPGDFSRLYRRHNLEAYGIHIDNRPECNVDDWLNSGSPLYKPELAQAIFYYTARTDTNDRLKVCISTPEMQDAAWTYCHKKQVVVDGTFGLCSSRLLLWIALGIDETGAGLPVSMFLFSAPTGTKATHAGYDTAILAELFACWKNSLGVRNSERFEPYVAITDTDTRERGALMLTWPEITLILCKFHVRQCWTNKRKHLLPKGETHRWRSSVKAQLFALEEALLDSVRYEVALALLGQNEADFTEMLTHGDPHAVRVGEAALSFLAYLRSTWMSVEMWKSWSKCGREEASQRLKIPISGVLPTTNHLEALNGSLKKKYIPQWKHAGRRLRHDVLIHHLVKLILPQIYAHRRMVVGYTLWKAQRFEAAANGLPIMSQRESDERVLASQGIMRDTPRVWFSYDQARDDLAREIIARGLLRPITARRLYEQWAKCESSRGCGRFYWLTFHPSGHATCTCPDFLVRRIGACKHLRAYRIVIEDWIDKHQIEETYRFPTTTGEAIEIELKNRRWYETTYDYALTAPAVNENLHSSGFPVHFAKCTGLELENPPPGVTIIPPPLLTLERELMLQSDLQPTQNPSDWEEGDEEDKNSQAGEDSCLPTEAIVTGVSPIDMMTSHTLVVPIQSDINLAHNSNTQALTFQLQTHLDHDIQSVLPMLHGIITTLSQPDPRIRFAESPPVQELRQILGSLDDKLSQVGLSTHTNRITHITPIDKAVNVPRENQKRQVRAPSPEKLQKRKKSYKTL